MLDFDPVGHVTKCRRPEKDGMRESFLPKNPKGDERTLLGSKE